MATVTGFTAARMQAIEDGSTVSAGYDSAGHLILTKHDGTQLDAGRTIAATTAASGIVELATSAETQAGTDTTRAITPAGLASLPGYRAQILASNSLAETATPASWPYAVSMMPVSTGSGWTPNAGVGLVICYSIDSTHTVQDFYANPGTGSPKIWTRSYNGQWSNWAQKMVMINLDPTAFLQTTSRGNYPTGQSRLYFSTSAAASTWDFSALAPGEVITYIADDANFFGRQTFTQHAGGSTNPVQWFRTANQAGGWTAWQKVITDPGAWTAYTPTWTTQTGAALPSYGNATIDCRYIKIGRMVTVRFNIAFGTTTNFGSGATGNDNWRFSLPFTAARASDDGLGIMDMYQSAGMTGLARVKISSSTSYMQLNILQGSASGIGADADSITPFNWASGNTLRGTFTYESAT
jgi:hypothetical protein